MTKLMLGLSFVLFSLYTFGQDLRKTLETPFSKYRVSTKFCSKLTHSSGSIIFIPDNAFDIDANKVDSVDIYYREIRSPKDMIVHNIPMTFVLMNKSYFLESNGMFEIWCKSGEQEINIHEDRSIEVRFAIAPEEIDISMEGFQFNSDTRLWDSYTSQIGRIAINESDVDLWGSDAVGSEGDLILEDEFGELWTVEDSLRKVAFQAMEIFDFGLYNYDKIISNETYVSVKASFIDSNQKNITSSVYVVYDEINSVFEYPEYNWDSNFSIIAGRNYKLISIDKDGTIYALNKFPDLNAIKETSYTFKLEPIGSDVANKQEFGRLTGIR